MTVLLTGAAGTIGSALAVSEPITEARLLQEIRRV